MWSWVWFRTWTWLITILYVWTSEFRRIQCNLWLTKQWLCPIYYFLTLYIIAILYTTEMYWIDCGFHLDFPACSLIHWKDTECLYSERGDAVPTHRKPLCLSLFNLPFSVSPIFSWVRIKWEPFLLWEKACLWKLAFISLCRAKDEQNIHQYNAGEELNLWSNLITLTITAASVGNSMLNVNEQHLFKMFEASGNQHSDKTFKGFQLTQELLIRNRINTCFFCKCQDE